MGNKTYKSSKLVENLSYLFYKKENMSNDSKIEKILNFNNKNEYQFENPIEKNNEYVTFSLRTTYPGLLVGIGNVPMLTSKIDKNNTIKLGFSFDYVTGLPYIPGSSIKGTIRSRVESYNKVIMNWMRNKGIKDANIDVLIDSLFGSSEFTNTKNRDVFFDATISNAEYGIFSDDYITPHKELFSNVIPIRMLKIKPDVEFKFCFLIRKKTICGLNESDRLELYKSILKELGIGAKTNVGYGFLK